jgi:hypothetical protein
VLLHYPPDRHAPTELVSVERVLCRRSRMMHADE